MKVVVFGGAGFVGSHLVDALIARGDQVVVFDNLDPQVHGAPAPGAIPTAPSYLHPEAKLVVGDVRDRAAVEDVLSNAEAVFYLAAAVGVGQSMYEISRYIEVNSLGAAIVLEQAVAHRQTIRKLVVASSMSVYGEGCYLDQHQQRHFPALRSAEQLLRGEWEFRDSTGTQLQPVGTTEDKPLVPTSVYAISKRDHEELFLSIGAAYQIPAVALRFFNIYGPRQALSNPYTGVAAIFSSLILNGKPPRIYEDGKQTRDFVHVSDIVQALLLSLDRSEADGEVLNIGSGTPISILQVAELLSQALNFDVPAEVTGKYRVGDIRHCFADISKAERLLGYRPKVAHAEGFAELAQWVSNQQVSSNKVESSTAELLERKLLW